MIKALVPVRAGSQRIKDKNVRPFAESNLLEIKIRQLQRIDRIEEICVNSDSQEMLDIASSLGATPILRDPFYATSTVPMNEVWAHMAQNMKCDDILYTNATSPLVKDESYQELLDLWDERYTTGDYPYDSITTTHEVIEYLWDGIKALNYDPSHHPRSQDLPEYFGLNFAISIIPRSLMIARKSILGKDFLPFKLDKIECLDIDEIEDFQLAEIIYRNLR